MQPISVEAFASMVMKNNKGYRKKELVKTLNETLTAKKNGAKCIICGAPIWAAGSAIARAPAPRLVLTARPPLRNGCCGCSG